MTIMVVAKKFIYVNHFVGLPTRNVLNIVTEDIPPITDGEFLAEAVFISVDPYIKDIVLASKYGDTVAGAQIAKIIESKNLKYPIGRYIEAYFGWRSHTVSDGTGKGLYDLPMIHLLPDDDELPLSLYLGVLGMPGNTAYFGFLEICKPQPGETILVTCAAGAVGSHVGQIAKIKGCKVIGLVGTDEKVEFVQSIGFDHAINYRTCINLSKTLEEIAPNGIDCYFDSVGGETSSIILQKLSKFGRVAVCGHMSSCEDVSLPKATMMQPAMIRKEIKMEGFNVSRWNNRWNEGVKQNKQWIREGKLKYRETVTEDFEQAISAWIGMYHGENIGKSIVKI